MWAFAGAYSVATVITMANTDGLSNIVGDKIDKNNFLMGKGYWEYIEGDQEKAPEIPEDNPTAAKLKTLKDWNQGAQIVMYWMSISIQDTMIGHI